MLETPLYVSEAILAKKNYRGLATDILHNGKQSLSLLQSNVYYTT